MEVLLGLLEAHGGLGLDEIGLLLVILKFLGVKLVDPLALNGGGVTLRRSFWRREETCFA